MTRYIHIFFFPEKRIIFLEEFLPHKDFNDSAIEDSCHGDSASVSGTSKTLQGAGTFQNWPWRDS